MADEYSFCESVHATSRSLWHIRKLTDVGKKLGGGIDTGSLCTRVRRSYGWDLGVPIGKFHLEKNTCAACKAIYDRAMAPFEVGEPVRHKDLRGHVEMVVPQVEGKSKYHVRWSTGDLLFYAHDDLEDDDE